MPRRCGRRRSRRRRPGSPRITSVRPPGARGGTAPASSSAGTVTTFARRRRTGAGWQGNRCHGPPRHWGTGPGRRRPLRMPWVYAPVTAESGHGPGCPLFLAWTAQCLHLSPGKRQASTEPRMPGGTETPTLPGRPFRTRPSQQSPRHTLTPDRVTHIKCYHCYITRLLNPADTTGAKWAIRAYESYRPAARAGAERLAYLGTERARHYYVP